MSCMLYTKQATFLEVMPRGAIRFFKENQGNRENFLVYNKEAGQKLFSLGC